MRAIINTSTVCTQLEEDVITREVPKTKGARAVWAWVKIAGWYDGLPGQGL